MEGKVGMKSLRGLLAVVTGGGSGIGKSIALEIAASGATVMVVGRRENLLTDVALQARSVASNVVPHSADITRGEDINRLSARIQNDYGRLDILVHCAATISLGSMDQASVKDLDTQYKTNVQAPYSLTQSLLPMLKLSQGQIVFMNSSVGLRARSGIVQYAATKHSLRAIADGLRDEVNSEGIRVLSVYVGRTASAMQEAICEFEGIEYHPERLLQPKDVATIVVNALQLPRTAEVTDISIRPMKKN